LTGKSQAAADQCARFNPISRCSRQAEQERLDCSHQILDIYDIDRLCRRVSEQGETRHWLLLGHRERRDDS